MKSVMELMQPITFTVPLTQEAYQLANNFSKQHKQPDKAREVYFNTLAVYAVNFYCQCLEIETDLTKSHSQNLVWQKLMNIADLEIKNIGKLECRYFLPNASHVSIPPEVWFERIGYIAVEIKEDDLEAILTGFIPQVNTELIPNDRRDFSNNL